MKIALIAPSCFGGVKIVTLKLFYALKLEGFEVGLFNLDTGVLKPFMYDALLVNSLKVYDAIIYTGSVARASCSFLKGKRTFLFIHGFLFDEYKNTILHSTVRTRLGAMLELAWWRSMNMELFKPDVYICHSETTRNANRIASEPVFLPQFILPSEAAYFERLKGTIDYQNGIPKIVTYKSYAYSPRLLSQASLIRMSKQLAVKLNRKVVFYIIDPLIPHEVTFNYGLVKLQIIKPMPHAKFLQFLVSSDLYIEPGVDEEIGLDTLEAGLLGVPLAKITYPQYESLQDYTGDEVLKAPTEADFVDLLSKYLNDVDYYRLYYGLRFRQFLLAKRSWNAVKKPLMAELAK